MTIAPIGNLATIQSAHVEAPTQAAGTSEAPNAGESQASGAASGEGGFSGALGQALNSLEGSQAAGETAAAQVATGSTSNPEAAVTKVMDAELEMQLASQIRSKASEAVNTIFQTQI